MYLFSLSPLFLSLSSLSLSLLSFSLSFSSLLSPLSSLLSPLSSLLSPLSSLLSPLSSLLSQLGAAEGKKKNKYTITCVAELPEDVKKSVSHMGISEEEQENHLEILLNVLSFMDRQRPKRK